MAIMAILVLLAAPKYLNYVKDAEVVAMEADIRLIEDIVERDQIEDPDKGYPVTDDEPDLSDEAKKAIVDDIIDASGGEDYPKDENGDPDYDAIIDKSKVKPVDPTHPSWPKDEIKNTKDKPSDYVIVTEGPSEGDVYHKDGYTDSDGNYHNGLGGLPLSGDKEKIPTSSPASDFRFDPETGTILEYIGTKRSVVIPSKIGGKDVVYVGGDVYDGDVYRGAFQGKDISSVTIYTKKNITIQKNAFTDAFTGSASANISITGKDVDIENNAFKYASMPDSDTFTNNVNIFIKGENVTIGDMESNKNGYDGAFYYAFNSVQSNIVESQNVNIDIRAVDSLNVDGFKSTFGTSGSNSFISQDVKVNLSGLDVYIDTAAFESVMGQHGINSELMVEEDDEEVINYPVEDRFFELNITGNEKLTIGERAFDGALKDSEGNKAMNRKVKIDLNSKDVDIQNRAFKSFAYYYSTDSLTELYDDVEIIVTGSENLNIDNSGFASAFTTYSTDSYKQNIYVYMSGDNVKLGDNAFSQSFKEDGSTTEVSEMDQHASFTINSANEMTVGKDCFRDMFAGYKKLSKRNQTVDLTLNANSVTLDKNSFYGAFVVGTSDISGIQKANITINSDTGLDMGEEAFECVFSNFASNTNVNKQGTVSLNGTNLIFGHESFTKFIESYGNNIGTEDISIYCNSTPLLIFQNPDTVELVISSSMPKLNSDTFFPITINRVHVYPGASVGDPSSLGIQDRINSFMDVYTGTGRYMLDLDDHLWKKIQ